MEPKTGPFLIISANVLETPKLLFFACLLPQRSTFHPVFPYYGVTAESNLGLK
jgi:hypothetical protein